MRRIPVLLQSRDSSNALRRCRTTLTRSAACRCREQACYRRRLRLLLGRLVVSLVTALVFAFFGFCGFFLLGYLPDYLVQFLAAGTNTMEGQSLGILMWK